MAESSKTLTFGDPSLNLQVTKQLTEVTVFPESQLGGGYDRARITTALVINNPGEATRVEFLVPYVTPAFSASIAVVSRGAEEYHKRQDDINPLKGDLDRIKPYLAKLLVPSDLYDTPKELKEQAKLFRAGVIDVPTGVSTVEVSVSVVIEPKDINGVPTFALRAYAPLPGLQTVAAATTKLSVSARFKGDETIRQKFPTPPKWTNPYGDSTNVLENEIPQQQHGDDQIFWWKFKYDPVIDFEYHY